MNYQSSKSFPWKTHPIVGEKYVGETGTVNIDFLKIHLSENDCPVFYRNLNDIKYQRGEISVYLNGTERHLGNNVDGADYQMPVILSLLPRCRDQIGHVIWEYDVVDGLHRLAKAKQDNLEEMLYTLVMPEASFLSTRPSKGYEGEISKETNFWGLPIKHPLCDLSKDIGLRAP